MVMFSLLLLLAWEHIADCLEIVFRGVIMAVCVIGSVRQKMFPS